MSWPINKLSTVAQINPSRTKTIREDNTETSFIPMEGVDGINGIVIGILNRPYAEVKKGYTYFEENDVIFAKITPCMQNGKHAIVRGLLDGIGFGSTEFHIIRCSNEIIPEWVHFYLRRQETLDAAIKTFTGTVGQQRVPTNFLENLEIPVPVSVEEQRQIATRLKAQLAEVETARKALELQQQEIVNLANAIIHESIEQSVGAGHARDLSHVNVLSRARPAPTENGQSPVIETRLGEVLKEVKKGIGETWADYPVLGATRGGLAPAKEPPGKHPQRYKPVFSGTVFYNPMRILIGSIAFVDDDDEPGITSPDYVALQGKAGLVDSRWFYYWLRSPYGEQCINSLARGAVRERMLFNRLAEGSILLPSYQEQLRASKALSTLKPIKYAIQKQLNDLDKIPERLLAQAFKKK